MEDFNTQNQTGSQGSSNDPAVSMPKEQSQQSSPPFSGGIEPSHKKSKKKFIVVIIILIVILFGAWYVLRQGSPEVEDVIMEDKDMIKADEAGGTIDLNADTTGSIEEDIDITNFGDIDAEFEDIDAELQNL